MPKIDPSPLLIILLELFNERLNEVYAVAKTADACLKANDPERAFNILLDVEQPVYEAGHLLNAAAVIRREMP